MWKHRVKMGLRAGISRWGFRTGLWRLANRRGRSGRITILTLHCVGHPEATDYLPGYMKLAERDFDDLLAFLVRHFEVIDLAEAVRRLGRGEGGRNAVVLTLDDGYRDNYTHAYPLLRKHGVPATIFLEGAAVDRRGLSWINKYFFVDHVKDPAHLATRFAERLKTPGIAEKLARAVSGGGNVEYAVKRILKYEADEAERDRIMDALFREAGATRPAFSRRPTSTGTT